jgi:hypothetical protein
MFIDRAMNLGFVSVHASAGTLLRNNEPPAHFWPASLGVLRHLLVVDVGYTEISYGAKRDRAGTMPKV